jgi:nucleoside-diphosphate-sugar epimerase
VTKLAGEQYARAFHVTYGLETVSLRYFNIFGARQDPASQYAAVIPLFIVAAVADRSPTIFGDGEQTRDFTYVANAVRANMLACEAPSSVSGNVYNVGCGARISVNELWSQIAKLLGSSVKPHYERSRVGDVRDSLASLDRIRRDLGYEPLVSLEDGLRRTVESFTQRPAHPSPQSVVRSP